MKKIILLLTLSLFVLSCSTDKDDKSNFISEITKVSTDFNTNEFEDEIYYSLLEELNICVPIIDDSLPAGTVPCSPEYFAFYAYNNKRSIEDAFLLQVRKGVNNYPYRRLLVFVRERGDIVLATGVVGYLAEKRSTEKGIDDLVVAVVDNIGGKYERYDVLLTYEDGKYRFVEALGDLEGEFEDEALKERASKMIKQRIEEKKLIF